MATNLERYEQQRREKYDRTMREYSDRDEADRVPYEPGPVCHPQCRLMPVTNFGGDVLRAAAHDVHHEDCPFHPDNQP